ncbi:pseudoazurin (plasmid) [Maritalea myrionectae]|uniref:Pseudoazurin n=1 Tax=Maritalea myrionectae TaxID=454601 RepID=A0A2R4MJ90_9HYPH|nr:pseudoazurin [Maritalea myrionectae]AVX06034.1 pseudoazurin [Maritalea myrionectae]
MGKTLLAAFTLGLALTGTAVAEDFTIKMLNQGEGGERMVYEPAFLHIQPGDSVTFEATDPSHNAETILGIQPEGAEAFKGRINEEITITFEQEGVYGYKCLPHYGLGMVGLILVGNEAENLDEAQTVKMPPKAQEGMAFLFESATEAIDETKEETD